MPTQTLFFNRGSRRLGTDTLHAMRGRLLAMLAAPADAAIAWRALRQRWPGNLLASMGQGNALHAAGDLAGAARAFEDAPQQHNSAAAWNNLARTRASLGDAAGGRAAAARAVARARAAEPLWLAPALLTERDLAASP